MVEQLYGKGTKTRFRPHHFPFTEPSCEMDVQCHKCGGVGCPTCKGEGWIELLGAGMVHPKVLKMAGIDPEVYSTEIHSFSLEKSYTLRVSRRYLDEDDRVLLVDDILANGQSVLGLAEIVSKARAEVAGVAVAIEKAMQDGGKVLRRMGFRVEALACVDRVENGTIILADD